MVSMKAFSMNMPFAGLIAHGEKTLETRNHTMFEGTEGQRMALHVGQRTYPDGGKHKEILREGAPGISGLEGMDDATIARVTSLPKGMSRGQVVAIVTLGKTTFVPVEAERSTPEVQRRCVATGAAMGRYLTEVAETEWLEEGVPMRGRPGCFDVELPERLVPARRWSIGGEE